MLYTLKAAEKRYGRGRRRGDRGGARPTSRSSAASTSAIVGPSGSGKTTVLQLLGALDRPSAGEILFEGEPLGRMGDADLARLRRDHDRVHLPAVQPDPDAERRARTWRWRWRPGLGSDDRRQRADALLDRVGLATRTHHLPSELSGGEQQRVAIARALANEPRVLLADEPTGNLDSTTGEEVMESVERLWRERGLTVILVTHDGSIAERAPRVIQMRDGSIVRNASRAPAA